MRNVIGPLLAALLLAGCEDGKPITPPPPDEKPAPTAPAEATPPPATPAADAPRVHGATGVGDTAPAPEREPPKASSVPPSASEWGRKGDADGGSASDAGSGMRKLEDREEGTRPGQRGGPRSGDAKGPISP